MWQSVDPPILNGHYLDFNHDGGVLNSLNLGAYVYCRQNPVYYFDPDGNQTGFELRQRRRDLAVLKGDITPAQYREQNKAEGYGALAGLSLIVPDPSDIVIGGVLLRFFGLFSKAKKTVKVANKASDVVKNPYLKETASELSKSKKSFEKLIKEHKKKLKEYKANPDKFDNKKILEKASPENRKKIIEGRIKALKRQIQKQQGELKKIKEAIKKTK